MPIVENFWNFEEASYELLLRRRVADGGTGQVEFECNEWGVLLDFDAQTATVEEPWPMGRDSRVCRTERASFDDFFARRKNAHLYRDDPEGWTDEDCSIVLPEGCNVDDIVDVVLACGRARRGFSVTFAELTALGVSDDDASFAINRVYGGLNRARTGNRANEPRHATDPIAYASFHRAVRDHSVLTVLDKVLSEGAHKRRRGRWWGWYFRLVDR